jgi:hypothetical protein
MTLRVRRILYISLIVAFFILAPVIILYTAGYRYNFKKMTLEKTGIIFVSTVPAKTNIYVHNELVAKTTPAIIKNLLPDSYDLRISASGYLNWSKKLEVQSQLTTFVNRQTLLKDQLPILLSGGKISALNVSPDFSALAFLAADKKQSLKIINLADNKIDTLIEIKTGKTNIDWSSDSNWVLIYNDARILGIFDKSNSWIPADLTNLPAGKHFWSAKNKNSLYIVSGVTLFSFNLKTAEIKKITTLPRATGYLVVNDRLWFLSGGELKFWDFERAGSIETVAKVDFTNAGFVSPGLRFFGVTNGFKGLVVDATQKRILSDMTRIEKVVDFPDGNNLIASNEFEIWLVDKNSGNRELVTRQAAPILNALWHQSGQYIIFASKNNIEAIELDSREPRNRYQFLSGKDISGPIVSDDTDFFFPGRVSDNEEGVFKLGI